MASWYEKYIGKTNVDYRWVSNEKDGDQTKNPAIFDHINVKNTVPAQTQAYVVVLSDKLLTIQSDGSKMAVVY